MLSHAERVRARVRFEAALAAVQQQYALAEDGLVEATVPDGTGQRIVVARYKLYRDGHFACFEVLDDVLWPTENHDG